ncbi:MAG TPA: SOS response-associated peptidase [Burkholderiales bacterium]|jgi:putative SOS response-associated peptidase YedK|nr:SOS response-associated peptidase [Burkholderiales bacterium]
MCGRYALHSNPEVVRLEFGLGSLPDFAPRYNIAPMTPVLIIKRDGAALARWGLVPRWSNDASVAAKLINARAETLGGKPSFRNAYHRRRCLIPANGFYEWKREGELKQPYYVHPAGGELFAFAGLWDTWCDMDSCTIITSEANATLRPVHDRMPVIIAREHYAGWLHGEEGLLRPPPAGAIRCYPVSLAVNGAANESPALIAPLRSEPQKSIFD